VVVVVVVLLLLSSPLPVFPLSLPQVRMFAAANPRMGARFEG